MILPILQSNDMHPKSRGFMYKSNGSILQNKSFIQQIDSAAFCFEFSSRFYTIGNVFKVNDFHTKHPQWNRSLNYTRWKPSSVWSFNQSIKFMVIIYWLANISILLYDFSPIKKIESISLFWFTYRRTHEFPWIHQKM